MKTITPTAVTDWALKPLYLCCMLTGASIAYADTFSLGEVKVTAARPDATASMTDTQDQEQMRDFNRETVGRALDAEPGITMTEGGPRNEQMITIRGFDLRQVPVFVDGIPVYVSYDGYVDLGRFNTFDLAKIDVSKGFSSVLYGPNTLGGAVNLVSRKPTSELEGDVTAGMYMNRNLGSNGLHTDVNAGGNHGTWYWQASGSYLNKNQYQMSSSFVPTKFENGGNRDNSYNRDQKLNLKAGYTPREGDEYTLNYINQQGTKGTPAYAGTDPASINSAKFWQWPYWNKESLYYISRTGIGAESYLKVRVYYDKFQNSIQNFSNGTYTTLSAIPFSQSWYDDYSYGSSAEFGTRLGSGNTLKFAAHIKDDIHREHNLGNPVQHFMDQTTSLGVEDTQSIGQRLGLVTGISLDARETKQAENFLAGQIVNFQKDNTSAFNPQAGLFYHLSATDEIHATVARKSRFPTIKDRYSYRLGTAIPNAALQTESSTNYEIGASGLAGEKLRLGGALFYDDIRNMIQAVNIAPTSLCGVTAVCTQMQNAGNVTSKGLELSATTYVSDRTEIGANYTLIDRTNRSNPAILLFDVPRQKLYTYGKWQISDPLTLLGSIEANSWRYSSTTGTRIASGFGIANVKAMYQIDKAWSAEVGINNLLDKNYMVIEGYPMEGRNFIANATFKF